MPYAEVAMYGDKALLSIKTRNHNWSIAGVLGLLIIAALASIPLTLTVLHNRESDALVIDMAGRQRMLLERYMKELLLAGQGITTHHQDTRALLEQRLRVLVDGGSTSTQFGPPGIVSLPAAPTAEIRSKLLDQERLLAKFANLAEAFLAQPIATRESIRNELLEDNIALLTTANDAVALLTQHSEARLRQLIQWEVVVVVLVVTLATLGTWRFLKAEQALKVSQARTLEALRQSDAVKSSLLSSVSHELRTPLTSIKSMLFCLHHDGPLSRVSADIVASIEEQVDYLNRLVGNLLDMSRLDSGKLQPHREWNILEDLVEGAIRRLGIFIKDRPIDVQLAPDLPPISVDAVQVQQVLVNLLENAVKFSPPGSSIRLAASVRDRELEVSVTNTGEGIPPDELEKIFERFYRLVSRQSSRPPGTGLGLAICKGIIEAHGGRISARSIGGETIFLFRLPFTSPMNQHSMSLLPLKGAS
ncbi:MAG TPA: ATP-binding protein [Nitrospira sp.]|nr:ATP-binding protein [Nitrospira sp.]